MAKKDSIKKDLSHLGSIQKAGIEATGSLFPISTALLFMIAVFLSTHAFTGELTNATIITVAALLGAYMALNIGANDVANNVSPAVGSKALTMLGALVLAAIFETAGALIAGGNVVSTISKGIIDQSLISNSSVFIMLMLAALLAAALWLNLATYIGAPVSTTHSIVGGVMGSGIAAGGLYIVNWPTMGKIASSWIISPILGGIVAALLYRFIQKMILEQKDMLAASKRWVPILISIMAASFAMYLMIKGLKRIWQPNHTTIWITGAALFFTLPLALKPFIVQTTTKLQNNAKGVNQLFTVPLIVSAALLSFAHGSNDVANAVGPLAAIVNTSSLGSIASKVEIPLWVMLIGALGISFGLMLFGPKIIRTVGEKITKINQVRAFCIALSAAITVIIASSLGLPVSSTHITVGGVFGVGLYRELSNHRKRKKARAVESKKVIKRKLVRRKYLLSIIAAWVITVPCAALLSAFIFLTMQYFNFISLL